MKKLALAVGSILAAAAPALYAQDNSTEIYPYDPNQVAREQARDVQRWHRERQDDWRYYEEYSGEITDSRGRERRYDRDAWRDDHDLRRECWNPRNGRFEWDGSRSADRLDYSRCRTVRYWR